MSQAFEKIRLLSETVIGANFQINRTSAISGGFDPPQDDYIQQLWQWRQRCKDAHKVNHASFCERCDAAWQYETGGALWLNRDNWRVSPERAGSDSVAKGKRLLTRPIDAGAFMKPGYRGGAPIRSSSPPKLEVTPDEQPSNPSNWQIYLKRYDGRTNTNTHWFGEDSRQRVLVDTRFAAKINKTHAVNSREPKPMTDLNQNIADILRMANGTALSARERIAIPDDIMDAMAGDAAQEAIMKARVLEEMRKNAGGMDPRYVNLDLMEMEKGDVDAFLKKARSKIIKRSKGTRKGCCTRIGGVLDQLVGPEGGDWAEPKAAKDRGKEDPIGEEDDVELLTKIAEQFSISDHDADCEFAAILAEELGEGRKPKTFEDMVRGFSKKDAVAREMGLPGNTDPSHPTSGAGRSIQVAHKEDSMSESSNTANALASFMEASYAAGAQKHTSERGDLSPKTYSDEKNTRPDNAAYNTELMPAKSGGSRTAGDLASPKGKQGGRYEKGKDPIGEDKVNGEVSATALALAAFTESYSPKVLSSKHSSQVDALGALKAKENHGEEGLDTRPDNKKDYVKTGQESAKSERKGKPRYDKGADPIGNAGDVENKDRRGGKKAKPF